MAEDAENNSGDHTTDPSSVELTTQAQTPEGAPIPPADSELLAGDLLHAAHALPPEMIAQADLTFDHLSTSVDLFDVPPFDHGDAGGHGDPGGFGDIGGGDIGGGAG